MIRILDTNLNFVDYMRKYTFSQYTVKFRGIGEFKVNAQLVPENLYLLDKTKQFFILFSGKTDEQFGIIESAEKTSDSETEQTLVLSGRMANAILDKRVIYRTVKFRGKTHDFVKTVIEDNLILSEDESRNMNINLTLSDKMLMEQTGTTISKQVTGGYLWDAIEPILEVDALGVKFVPVVKPKQNADDINIDEWDMVIVKGTDRRKGNQDLRPPVVFSQSVSNIKQTEYRTSVRDYRNFVYIAGEGAAGERKWYTKEINSSDSKGNTGWNRSELWIDARDIQSEDAEGNTIPEAQYEQLIDERIDEKAEEASVVENYDSTIVQENKLYVYGEDYFLGDFVTVIDKELNITIDVQITEVTVSEQDAQTIFDIGLTYGAIKRDLVQQISINKKTSTGNENSIRYLEAQIKKISSGGGGGGGTTPEVTNIDNIAVNFDYAGSTAQREQISTGDTVSTLFKKIRKWFSDLKDVAFTGKYSDLSGAPDKLPNPNRLTFTGAQNVLYDGSEAKTVTIPSVPSSLPADGGNADTIDNKNLSYLLDYNNHTNTPEIPDKLPNPEKLIFTGAVTAEYDGSVQKTIEIPQGGGGSEYYDFVGTNEELQQAIADGTVTAGMKTWVTDDPEDGEITSEQVYEPNRVMVTDENGKTQSSTITCAELDHLSGVAGNVQEQIDEINSAKMLLWENINPTAEFAEQEIELISSDFDTYEIIFLYTNIGAPFILSTKSMKGSGTILFFIDSQNNSCSRIVTWVGSNSLKFSDANYYKSGVLNNRAVPIRIYGYKEGDIN